MALFKIFKGLDADLSQNKPNTNEGYCYFTTDTGKMYIDIQNGTNTASNSQYRVCLNAETADRLVVDAGSSTKPVYFENGIPKACTNSLSEAGSSLGLVKTGGDVTISNGIISVNDDSHDHIIDNIDNLQNELDLRFNIGDKGTEIPAGEDLNSYTTPGHYFAPDKTRSQSLINCPITGSGFRLIVITGYNTVYPIQLILAYGNNIWYRSYENTAGKWPDWFQLTKTWRLSDFGITATATELNYTDGVTSNIQTQLDDKAALKLYTPQIEVTSDEALDEALYGYINDATFTRGARHIVLYPRTGVTALPAGTIYFADICKSSADYGTILLRGYSSSGDGIRLYARSWASNVLKDWVNLRAAMVGATTDTAGVKGLVPAPAAGKENSYLQGDGTWTVPNKVLQSRSVATKYRPILLHHTQTDYGVDPGAVTNGVYYNENFSICPEKTILKAPIFEGALTGNATSATQLQNARNFKIGETSKSFDGTANVSWTDNEIGYLNLVTRGTELANETDLNSVNFGNFFANNSTKAATLINAPITTAGFRLFSVRGYNSTSTAYQWQFATSSSRSIYQRYKGSGDWGEWGTVVLNPSLKQLGSATQPVYIGASGTAIACTAYSGLLTAFTSATNTLTLTVGGTTKTAAIVNSISNTWANGTTAGPTLKTTVNGVAGTAVAIPAASASYSGIVTTGTQHFAGQKFFNTAPVVYNHDTSPALYFYPKQAKRTQGSVQCYYSNTDGIGTGNRMQIVEWSYNSTTAAANSYYEIYNFPLVTADRTSNATYEIFTSKSYTTLDSRYVNSSGDTMTGILTFKNTTAKPTNGQQLPIIRMTYQNGDGTYYANNNIISLLGTAETGATNSAAVRFGSSNGCTYITSGESGTAMPAKLGASGEQLYLTSDSGIYFYTSCANDGSSYTQTLTLTSSKITANVKLYGAVWNDYAEFRECKEEKIPYGRVVIENGDDTLSLCNKRLQKGCNICSDTFGFAIGETETAKMPIAVSGRALVYTYEDRYSYEPGDAVCSAPNGTISKMTREEIKEYPDCIIGYVSAIPEYETWGEDAVKVDNRIWIKVI